jgi:hypothetical protein
VLDARDAPPGAKVVRHGACVSAAVRCCRGRCSKSAAAARQAAPRLKAPRTAARRAPPVPTKHPSSLAASRTLTTTPHLHPPQHLNSNHVCRSTQEGRPQEGRRRRHVVRGESRQAQRSTPSSARRVRGLLTEWRVGGAGTPSMLRGTSCMAPLHAFDPQLHARATRNRRRRTTFRVVVVEAQKRIGCARPRVRRARARVAWLAPKAAPSDHAGSCSVVHGYHQAKAQTRSSLPSSSPSMARRVAVDAT